MTFYSKYVKRIMDIIFSAVLIVVLLPLFILIGVVIKLDSIGNIIFSQTRVGYNEVLFKIYKFRSMVPNAENMGAGTFFDGENDSRITRVGMLLRKSSLDELPQLFNIIKGNMSFIGPRPSLPKTHAVFTAQQKKRVMVRPGITGLAQVNGRNELTWDEKVEFDLMYIKKCSFILDMKIFFKTIIVVILRKGIRMDQKPEDVYGYSSIKIK